MNIERALRRTLIVLLALPLLSGCLQTLSADAPGYAPQDGAAQNYSATANPISALTGGSDADGAANASGNASDDASGGANAGLPAIGSRKALLKLLLKRGALYDSSSQNNGGRGGNAYPDIQYGYAEGEDNAYAPPAATASPGASPGGSGMVSTGTHMEDAEADGGYSQTNEQTAGVSEGDIVKTDGRFIYAMSIYGGELRIIRAAGRDPEIASRIALDDISAEEFYLIGGDRLAVVGREYVPYDTLPAENGSPAQREESDYDYYYGWYRSDFTTLVIYDITDRSAPRELRRVSMDGGRISTRVIGDIVYIVTNKYMWCMPYDDAEGPYILPYCNDTAEGDGYGPIGFDRIHYIPDTDDFNYMLIGAIDVYGDEPFEPRAYLGAGADLYMSQNAMYLTKTRWAYRPANTIEDEVWMPSGEKTDILRFVINGTDVSYIGTGTVDGSPISQYSMDEYNGYFRIATNDWTAGTYVTVLDASDMVVVGRAGPLAPGERMQSMRFMGDLGYVVTFQNMDPLFTIDLSDPFAPEVLGELKIPGFSQYLHPLGGGLLLGIGRDTQEIYTRDANGVETIVGFRDVGMKVSLFDVSDPYAPVEIDTMPLGEGWTEVSYNPRALMCDNARGQYGFFAGSWDSRSTWTQNALILRVENGRLSIAARLSVNSGYDISNSRLCFIGDTLYLVYESGVAVYDYDSFEFVRNFSF